MKTRTRDLILIAAALLVVFGSGHVFGYLLGSRGATHPIGDLPVAQVKNSEWGTKTLKALTASLQLSEEQQSAIRFDVETVSLRIADAREKALLTYHRELLQLHDLIEGKLEESQQAKLAESKAELQRQIDRRFPESE